MRIELTGKSFDLLLIDDVDSARKALPDLEIIEIEPVVSEFLHGLCFLALHCGLPRDELLPLAAILLEIPDPIVLDALRLELDAGEVIADQIEGRDCVFLAGLYHAERSLADRLHIFSRGDALETN